MEKYRSTQRLPSTPTPDKTDKSVSYQMFIAESFHLFILHTKNIRYFTKRTDLRLSLRHISDAPIILF